MNSQIKVGLKENWKQFTLLVIINAFVGGMVGMERSIFPEFAEFKFGISSSTAIMSFIAAFGITKALSNYYTGKMANSIGRKNLLIAGWIFAIPVPFLLMYGENWSWIIFANVLLGVSQGLTWSTTVIMKIDLVGEKNRGLAMGLNEFSGYLSVGLIAFLTGYIVTQYGITPYPFYVGVFLSIFGFTVTVFWVKDTHRHVQQDSMTSKIANLENIFIDTSFKNKTLSSVTQAGVINNLNDGMIWGILPIFLLSMDFGSKDIGMIAGIYPIVWGIGQLFTGKMSDVYSKKAMLFWGMIIQGLAIVSIPFFSNFYILAFISSLVGWGTALVYPTFLSVIAESTNPIQRPESIGTFRLWRDLGYVLGAIISGFTADLFGLAFAIYIVGGLTVVSAIIIKIRMP